MSTQWTRLSAPGDKCSAHWVHPSGWAVRHCGHPTALWPYFAVDPAHPDAITVERNGHGFQTLMRAFARVEGVLEGALETVDDGPTKHGHRRVIVGAELPAKARPREQNRDQLPLLFEGMGS